MYRNVSSLSVGILREAFRNLDYFRSVYESDGVDTVVGPEGIEICLWDLEYLYAQLPAVLPNRQAQAIEYFLVCQLKESDVAEMMGISPDNPIGTYATAGLKKLIRLIEQGYFPKFQFERRRHYSVVA